MKSIVAFLMFAISIQASAQSSCPASIQNNYSVEMPMAMRTSVTWGFCNTENKVLLFENAILTSDGGVSGEREMPGFVVQDVIEFQPCECLELRVSRDANEPLEHEVGFFWLRMRQIVPIEHKQPDGTVISVLKTYMPAFTYGYKERDKAELVAKIQDGKLLVSNHGKRPGRIFGAYLGDKKIDFEQRFFVRPDSEVDISSDVPFGLAKLDSTVPLSLFDSIGQVIPVN